MSLKSASNPFVGIRPFESSESLLFFGRQDQTMELLQRLHLYHFVAVTGGSGSGKSSLIRAGLIPSLKAGYLVNERDRWMIALMKPGQSPLSNLADALLEQLNGGVNKVSSAELVESIKEKGADALLEVLEPLWGNNTNFFLLVDQFEELFRFSLDGDDVEKKNEATEFVNILLALSGQKELPIYVVITMRSDFVGDCANFYGLPEAMNQSQFIVPRLNRLQLKSTIEGPVRLYNGVIDPALTARLLNDVQIVKDELPLLQHALMRIWDYEMNVDKSGELDLNDYEKVGGIEKALSNHADEALVGMTESELDITRKIFQSLTIVDEKGRKVRRPVRLTELEAITGASRKEIMPIVNRFIEGSKSFLIVSKLDNNDVLIDISHESLIRQWSLLSGWVDEESESGKTLLRLTESATLYEKKRKDLLMGNELQPVLLWYQTFKPGTVWAKRYTPEYEKGFSYLKLSEAEWLNEEQRKKRRRKTGFALLYSAIGLAFLALGFFWLRENKLRTGAVLALNVAKDSAQTLEQERDSLMAFLAIEKSNAKDARERIKTIETTIRETLLDSLTQYDSLRINTVTTKTKTVYIDTSEERIKQLAIQRMGAENEATRLMQKAIKELATNPTVAMRIAEAALQKIQYKNNSLYYFANKMYKENAFYKTVYNYRVCPLFHAISPDGSKVLTVTVGEGKILNVASGEVTKFSGINDKIYSVTFSPDGSLVLGGMDKGIATLWDASGNEKAIFTSIGDTGIISSVAFSPAANAVALVSKYGGVRLHDTKGNLLQLFHTKNRSYHSATFSPDGKSLFIAYNNTEPELWTTDGKLVKKYKSITGKVHAVSFSKDGNRIATGLENGITKLWDKDGFLLQEFREKGNNAFISSVAFSTDGTKILTASENGTAKLWHVNGYVLRDMKGEMTTILSAAFSPDEKKIFTGSLDGTVRVWDISGTFDKYTGAYIPGVELTGFLQGDKMMDELTKMQKIKFAIE